MKKSVTESIQKHLELVNLLLKDADSVPPAARMLIDTIKGGGTVFFCGNGGSAADSQHLAAELVGRFRKQRRAMPALALTTDTSILTSVGNDFSYSEVFSRQVEGLVRRNDLLVGLSTSGNSENVLLAVLKAKSLGARTLGLLGCGGGKIKTECDFSIVVPSDNTANIQEMHILLGHILCDLTEQAL